ncbi:hypothetical protein F53441_9562 [Fusarium austroafricanum]|uniref:Uncharacterized protein n=1 Tax=Fusarium austroafricanum TaxID=2364996 RepID=A0A8H4KC88_9HYPO|nr:hypothetical protein F53441_9562 [Fusarium austroafricanum]
MDDWGRISAITALVTVPIYASSFLLQPVFQKVKETAVGIYHWRKKCEAIRWEGIPHGPIHTLSFWDRFSAQSPRNEALTWFLYRAWQVKPKPVLRPPYLDVSKEYFLLDADVLLTVVFLAESSGSLYRQPDPGARLTLNFASTTAQFRVVEKENDFYVVGKLSNILSFNSLPQGFQGITKEDIRSVARGYSPFYRCFLRVNAGYEIAHPISTMRDIIRADWILAIGFSSDTIEPLSLYNEDKSLRYSEACGRVLEKIEWLRKEIYSGVDDRSKKLLDVAVKVVTEMNRSLTGSGAKSATGDTGLLADCRTIGRRLGVSDTLFALRLFKEYRNDELSNYDREQLEPILEEV